MLEDGDTLASSAIAYVEFRSAVARLRRMRAMSASDFGQVKSSFEVDWQGYFTVEPTRELLHTAGNLADQYGLRSYGAVHLASYRKMAVDLGVNHVEFSGFDQALNRAAQSLRRSLLRKERTAQS